MNAAPESAISPDWPALASYLRPVHTHLFRKWPQPLTSRQCALLSELDSQVNHALCEPSEAVLLTLAQQIVQEGGPDMAQLNVRLALYRVLKLAHLAQRPDREAARIDRALFRELWHLVRHQVQTLQGAPARPIEQLIYERGHAVAPPALAWCDGSYRNAFGQAGIVLKSPEGATVAELSKPVPAYASHDAELQALLLVLQTAQTQGYQALRIHVDATGLATYCQGQAPRKTCVDEQALRGALDWFSHVQLVKVPRLFNRKADALARQRFGELV